MAKDINNIIYRVEVDTKSGKVNIDGVTKSFVEADKAFLKLKKDMSGQLPELEGNLKSLKSASGGATASVMEMGRVISDAPYGIRGMANNLTQLVSQMGFTIKSAGSLNLALKEMWAAMMGPLGIVLAITAAISALDFFAGSTKKAKKESDALNSTFGENSTKLMVLKSVLDDSNISLEDKNELVEKANKEFKGLNVKLDENGRLTDESAKAIDRLSLSFIKNAKARAIAGLIQEEMAIQAKISAENIGSQIGYLEGFSIAVIAAMSGGQKALTTLLKKDSDDRNDLMDESESRVDRYIQMLKSKGAEGAKALFGNNEDKEEKLQVLQTPEEFESDALSLQSEIDAWNKKMLMAATKDKDQRLQLELVFYKKKQEARRKDREDEAYEELFKYEDKLDRLVKSGKMEADVAEEAKGTALLKTQEKVDLINGEHDRLIAKATEATNALRLGLGENEEGVDNSYSVAEAIEQYKVLMSGVTNFLDGEYQRQLTIEQNKTNVMNNELRERLNNENLSKSERKSIQLEIARNDEALRKKQEVIAKKRFKMQKAINIANALVDTYKNGVTAYGSQLIIGDPSSPLRAKIAQGVALAAGLANVAMIARQKFQSTAGGAPTAGALGGSGSGGNDRSFNFNLAGASRENQLANTLQGRFNQPLQAYVVSRDITNQQQLDEEITSSASFG
tara:strand:+ start:2276 stop:4315 length:2040 start_codon:yes stop_codon:yes gene_type:complete